MRWIYCKYCYKNVLPNEVSEFVNGKEYHQIKCSICDYGLTPSEEV